MPDVTAVSTAPTWSDFMANWDLFRDAVLSAVVAGVALGFLSVYVVLGRMVFVSAAITQGAGLGVALSFYAAIHLSWQIDPALGAFVVALAIAAIAARDWQRSRASREMVLGLAFATTSGLAVVIGSRISQEAHDIQAILFGAAVVVSAKDFHALLAIAAAVLVLHGWWYRGFTFASFDPLTARVHGLPVRLLDTVLLVSIASLVAQTASALGALPAFALSTLPGIAAARVGRGPLVITFVLASLFGAMAGVGGYLAAYFGELPVGASQTVVAGLVAIVALVAGAIGGAVRSRGRAR